MDKYNCHYPSDEIKKPDAPDDVTYPTIGTTIYWSCFGAEHYGGDCTEIYDTPYAARDSHKAICGGSNDPNPDVAGCGDEYYTCVDKHVEKHGAIGCTRSIRYTKFSTYLGEVITYKTEDCTVLFRRCTVTKGPHVYYKSKGPPSAVDKSKHAHTEKRRR